MPDRKKIENAVHHCGEMHICKGCPYHKLEDCTDALFKDMMETIRDLEDARKERDQLQEENQNLLKRLPVWKRVEDEKPPVNTQVKLWTKKGFEYIGFYTASEEFFTDGFLEITHKVTHWMPLDEAPTAGASPRPTENGEDENEKIRKR